MGCAISRVLAGAGYKVTAWNRTPRDFSTLSALGISLAEQAVDAVAASDLVILITSNYPSAQSALSEAASRKRLGGKTVVQLVSGSPDDAVRFAAWIEAQDALYLDGALKANPSDIGSPLGTYLIAGREDAFHGASKMLSAFGGRLIHLGEKVALAKAFDCALFARNYTWMAGYFEGLALAKASGIAAKDYTSLCLLLIDRVRVNIERSAAQIESDTYPPAREATVAVHEAAVRATLDYSEEQKLDMPALRVAQQYLAKAIAAGYGQHELAACFKAAFAREP